MGEQGSVRFDGRVAVVTGAGRGLGRQFALLLASRGASVVVNDIGVSPDAARYVGVSHAGKDLGDDAYSDDVAAEVVEEIERVGGHAIANMGDVAEPEGAGSVIDGALEAYGRIDIVINNAGAIVNAPFEELTIKDLHMALSVNVGGAFNILQAAWPYMKVQQYGRVVNVCSLEGVLIGSVGFEAYGAAKGALMGLTRSLAVEGQGVGISVNGLLPGAITRGNTSVSPAYERSSTIDRSPNLVAPAAIWLCHGDCDVTGKFYAATAASMRAIFTSAASGYQSTDPDQFSLEELESHWDEACERTPSITPLNAADFNRFRREVYVKRAGQ